MCQTRSAHQLLAVKLADSISLASRLGKTAANYKSRQLAYRVKGLKLSNGILNFGEHFKIISAERDQRHGLLLLVRLPNGRGAHIPMSSLTPPAQRLAHPTVVELLEG